MLKFIVDTQLPPQLARLLASLGFDAVHTTFYPAGHLLSDVEIVQIAISENRIVVTKDSDFLDHFLLRGIPPPVLLLQFGNIHNAELAQLFRANFNAIKLLFEQGVGLIIFDRHQVIGF
jgi:predicted nuclease of predicted toxin-antitoxin system